MQDQVHFYPVRAVSRSVTRRQAKRTSWFVLGTGFGVGCALFLSSTLSSTSMPFSWNVANQAPTLSISLMEKEVAELSTTKGIDVVAIAVPPKQPTAEIARVPVNEPVHVAQAPVVPVVPAPVVAAPALPAVAAQASPAPVAAPLPVLADAPRPAPNVYPLMLDLKVADGDTLMNILTDTGVSYQEAHNAVDSIRAIYDPKKLDIGQNVSVTLDKNAAQEMPVISSMNVPISNISSVQVTRTGEAEKAHFAAKEVKAQVFHKSARMGGKIESSLYETGVHSGIPANVLNELITAYSYDVDFQRDIHPGDKIDVMFDRMQTKEGAVAGNGNVLYAELNLSGKAIKIFRYADKAGNADYYNEKGESIRKAMLRTPINGAKITSAFGMRNHPILGYSRMHRGVDFGAPTGTPIYAAGDGVISFAGKKGGYGNYMSITHDKKYSSAYGHISRFASGMGPGKKVKQGQIIAYVGATGIATGPHLHYEILVNNTQVNPSGVKFKTGNILGGKELVAFRKSVAQIQAQLNSPAPKKVDVASNH